MKRSISIILGLAMPFALVSCFPKKLTGDSYSRNEVGQAQTFRTATVEHVRMVRLQGGQTVGTAIGTAAGAIAGSTVGGGSGETLGVLGGAAVGAVAGGAVEQAVGNKKAVELTVRFDDDPEPVVFVQQYSRKEKFNVGDRVRVIYGGDRVRVAP